MSRETKSTGPDERETAKGQKRKSGRNYEFFPDSCFLKGIERDVKLSFNLP